MNHSVIAAVSFGVIALGLAGFIVSVITIDVLRSSRSGNLLDNSSEAYLSMNVYRTIARVFRRPPSNFSPGQVRALKAARFSLGLHVLGVIAHLASSLAS